MSKMSYETAMKLLKRKFKELKESIKKNNLSTDWVDAQPVVTNTTTFIKANEDTKPTRFESNCPYFLGYYCTNGYGGVKCSLVNSALPGTVYDMLCLGTEKCKECPIALNKGLALRDAVDEFMVNFEK